MEKIDRVRGCLLGLAVGDALGAPYEFKAPGSYTPEPELVGGGTWGLPAGYWTDDTSMALCLAESLIERGFDPADQMQRYLRWYREGYLSSTGRCFDIGNATRAALERFERTGDPFAGDPEAGGNGALMRIAPVALYYGDDLGTAVDAAEQVARTTHGHPMALEACRYFVVLLWRAVNGSRKAELHPEGFHTPCPQIAAVVAGSWRTGVVSGRGDAANTLNAALWAFYGTESFEEGALRAVSLGEDTDTVGAVYGALAGAYYGEAGIPGEWREQLVLVGKIRDLAWGLYSHRKE